MMRVVLDTNVYISAVMFGGLPGALLDLAFLKPFDTLISPALIEELDEKLRLKFEVSAEDALAIRARIVSIAHLIEPEEPLHVIEEDPDDNRVLECAVAGRANTIVSGDRHLLKLASFRGIPIMRVREFLDVIEPNPIE
jgi:putative PIN family toxin of toxin-antitoxin system